MIDRTNLKATLDRALLPVADAAPALMAAALNSHPQLRVIAGQLLKARLLDLTSPISELSTRVASELSDEELCLIGDRIILDLDRSGMHSGDVKVIHPEQSSAFAPTTGAQAAAFAHLRRILLGQ